MRRLAPRIRKQESEPVKIAPAVARVALGVPGKARGAENRARSGAYVSDFRAPRNTAGRVQGQPQSVRGYFHRLSDPRGERS